MHGRTCALFLVAAAAVFSPAAGNTSSEPDLKWAQDPKKIYLTIGMKCNSAEENHPVLTEDTISFSCKDKAGKERRLSMLLREDILPQSSACKSVKGEEVCTMAKKYEHFWDRLAHDPTLYKHLKQDWSKWKDESEDQSASDPPYSSANDKRFVQTVSAEEYSRTIKESSVVFLDASPAWCSKCSFTRKAFAAAAKQLAGNATAGNATAYGKPKPVAFVYVNPLDDRQLARTYNITCDFPCYFYAVRHGVAGFEQVEAKGQDADILQAIEARLAPMVSKVASEEEAEAFAKMHAVSALVVLTGSSGNAASAEHQALQQAATQLRGKVALMWADKEVGGLATHEVRMWVNGTAARSVQWSSDAAVLARNLVALSWGYEMFNYSYNKRDLFDAVNLPIAHVFLDANTPPETVALFEDAAKELRGKMAFVRFAKQDSYMLKEFGLAEDAFPAFGIADQFATKAKRYGMEDDRLGAQVAKEIPDATAIKPADWNEEDDGPWEPPLVPNPAYAGAQRAKRFNKEAVLEFARDYLDGKLKPSYKSEAPPLAVSPPGKVRDVVYKTLHAQGAAGADEAVLLLLYKPYSQSKDKVLAVWAKLAEAFEALPAMRIAKMDSSKNHVDKDIFKDVDEYAQDPAVFLRLDGRVVAYTGALAQADILKFLAKNVKAVKAGWDALVKPKLKQLKDAAAEVKRLREEAEAKKKAEAAEERRKLEEKLAGAEKIDVSKAKDQGVIKQVLEAGEGSDTPQKGDKVTAHYTGTLLDGSKFDSSRDRGDPFTFTLGEGQVIPCWDLAFATMKKGEKAVLTCTSDNAYGDRGSGDKIPPKATLRFDVELVSWKSQAKSEL